MINNTFNLEAMNINILDIAVLAVLIFFAWSGGRKGLIRSVFGVCQTIAALLLTWFLYPTVSKVIREKTPVYETFKEWIADSIALQSGTADSAAAQIDIINSLPLPESLLKTLLANNNPEAYGVLRASDIQSYISGYIANALINVLCMVLVFVAVNIALRIAIEALDLVAKLPVISTFNQLGGVLAGLVTGGFAIWFILLVMTFFLTRDEHGELYALLDSSKLAVFFYDTNLLLNMILQIFV